MRDSVFGPIRQIAYVVDDIEKAINDWHDQVGIGPFALVRNCSPLAGSQYRGQPSGDIAVNLAFAYIDGVQLELIEPVNDTSSLYREALQKGAHSVHHYGVCVEDFPAAYQHAMANGFTAVVDAGVPGVVQMAYVESDRIEGLMFEIIEWNDLTRPYFDGIRGFLDAADDSVLIHHYSL